jgi:hypothetical protein
MHSVIVVELKSIMPKSKWFKSWIELKYKNRPGWFPVTNIYWK